MTLEERFWAKVSKTESCWLWDASTTKDGYGQFKLDGRMVKVHRLAYELLVGPIPTGLELDHQCHNRDKTCKGGPACIHRRCVNPAHLEAVTHAKNMRRGRAGAHQAVRTHCPQGHEYAGANLYLRPGGLGRSCRACQRVRDQEHRARKKAA